MKRLAVLRHAKSSWAITELGDLNRPLNERGWKAARRMGRELRDRGMHFDLVLASTAARVRETIDGLGAHFRFGSEIRFDPALYLADEPSLVRLLRTLPNSVEAPLLVGHNPGLQRLLIDLSHDAPNHFREKVAAKFPTAAFALLELPVDDWQDVIAGSGRIVDLVLPRELD